MPYKDKEKQKEAQRQHYLRNKSSYTDARKRNRDKRSLWMHDLKSNFKCISCGFDDPRCLDFHHKDESQKFLGISELVKQAYSEQKILEEIAKCEILCANCHSKIHHKSIEIFYKGSVTTTMNWLKQFKNECACVDCGNEDSVVLSFHHIGEKKKTISSMAHNGSSIKTLMDEIEKCEILCNNCHRIRHNGNVWKKNSLET